jgi:hypothetical protein
MNTDCADHTDGADYKIDGRTQVFATRRPLAGTWKWARSGETSAV